MVHANLRSASSGVTSALQDRNFMALAPLALLGAGGVVLAQEVVDMVAPLVGFPTEPVSARDLGLSAIVKTVAAMVLVALALRMGTTGKAVAGTIAFGMLVSVGGDLFDISQRGGVPGAAPFGGNSTKSRPPVRQASQPQVRRVSPAPAATASGSSGPSPRNIDNGSYR